MTKGKQLFNDCEQGMHLQDLSQSLITFFLEVAVMFILLRLWTLKSEAEETTWFQGPKLTFWLTHQGWCMKKCRQDTMIKCFLLLKFAIITI